MEGGVPNLLISADEVLLLQEVEVCIATVGVLGDICRAMEAQVAQLSDNIMEVLLKTLSDPSVDRTIKPQILSSFGDIALAVGDKFEPYLPHVLPMLQGAQHLSVEQQRSGNEALFEYNTQLRLGILEAYAGTVHALSNDKVAQYMTSEVPVRRCFGLGDCANNKSIMLCLYAFVLPAKQWMLGFCYRCSLFISRSSFVCLQLTIVFFMYVSLVLHMYAHFAGALGIH